MIQRPRTGNSGCTIYAWVTAAMAASLREYSRKHDIAVQYVQEIALRTYMLRGEPDCFPIGERDVDLNLSCGARLADDVDEYCFFWKITERELMNYALNAFDWTTPPDLLLWRRLMATSKPLMKREELPGQTEMVVDSNW